MILPIALVAVIVSALVAVMVVRGRSRGQSSEAVPGDDPAASKKESDEAPDERIEIDYSSATTELANEGDPDNVLPEEVRLDVDVTSHEAKEAAIYNLEDAQEFKVGNGEGEGPEE